MRRSLDPAEVFRTAVDELGVHLGVDRCLLFSLTGDTETVRCVAEYVAPGISPARREYPAAMLTELIESIRCEGVLTFDDIEHDARLRPIYENFLRHIGVRSIMYVAIRVGDDIPAALAFSTVTHARRWRDADVAVASAVAVQTGIAIRQAQLFKLIVGAKEEWETTFNAMSDAVLIFNEHGDLTRVNRAGAALERMIPENLIGRRCCQILHAEQADCIVTRALAEKRRLTDEISLPHFKRSLLFTAEPIAATDGRVIGAVCFVRDLSELRKIEAVAREQQSL
ncbi:MAG: GAF domain-containing protein [Pyrinomonadaceae bacterium]